MTSIDISNSILESSFPGIGNETKQTISFTIPAYSGTNSTLTANSTADILIGSLSGTSNFIQLRVLFPPLSSRYFICDTQTIAIDTTLGGASSEFGPTFYTSGNSLRLRYFWFTSSVGSVTTPVLNATAIVYFYLAPF